MFETLRELIVKGGCFEQQTTLSLFLGKSPLSIVYGRNGSGKTTIAQSIRHLVGKESQTPPEEEPTPSFEVSTNAIIPEESKKSVFIFDEDFLRENVRTKGRGLETIVMMGEQVDLDKQLTQKKEDLNTNKQKIENQTGLKNRFDNKNDTSSPLFFLNKIKDQLRKDDGWADFDRIIKGNSVKGRVTDDFIISLAGMEEPKEGEDILKAQLQKEIKLYTQTETIEKIEWKIAELKLPNNLDELKVLLDKRIESPQLNEREQRLLNFLQEHAEQHDSKLSQQMTEEKWAFCPLCLREMNGEDHVQLNEILKGILNREAETYKALLADEISKFTNIEIVIPNIPSGLYEVEINNVHLTLANLNKRLSNIRSKIALREQNVYGVFSENFSESELEDYLSDLENYKNALKSLLACVETINSSVVKRQELKKKLLNNNTLLARKNLSSLLASYKTAKEASTKCDSILSQLIDERNSIENSIHDLKAQIERTDIALEYINEELRYVFFSNKVQLAQGDGCYKLIVNGKNVPPKKISVGERNVLGLCYFFASLFVAKKKDEWYKEEVLLVIDDPISSFDLGNRLGVVSLLRHQFSKFKEGNSNSRMLVLTHDLRSAFDLIKVRSELNKGKKGGKEFFELSNKQLFVRKVSSEYKNLLTYVFDYAKNSAKEDNEMGIGNIMRRVAEAFSSFCYNCSFEEMMCREGILNTIPNEKRGYYENFMCRLTLNGESHMEERIYELNTITPYFTKQEKIQTAKSLLLFLSYVNKEHLSCYLQKEQETDEDRMAIIEGWKIEEKEWF